MSYQLIALDLDGTLLDHDTNITPRAVGAIRQAAREGVIVTLATGRMHQSALKYAQQLGLDVPLITYNGALVKSMTGEILFHQPVDKSVAQDVMTLFRSRGWYIQSYVDDLLYVREVNEKARVYERLSDVTANSVGDALYTVEAAPTKLLAMADSEDIAIMRDTVERSFNDKLYVAISKPQYLEMVNPAVNKGRALEALAARLGVKRNAVMAVGDSFNDIDMIEYAGLGVAMGDAPDAVKRCADVITAANDADGVALAIEKYVLGG